jgi:transcriptional regulator with XRE-family HTH domain
MITADQIRAARALLRLDQSELARRAGVSLATLRRVEAAIEPVSPRAAGSIRLALESAGAQFIPDGVRCPRTRSPEEVEARYRKIIEISERSAKLLAENPGGFSEDDLYDENGLPA